MKTTYMPFTKKMKLNINAPTLGESTLDISKVVKYLGITLKQKLTWSQHMLKITEKDTTTM